jgi:hypothetical protein
MKKLLSALVALAFAAAILPAYAADEAGRTGDPASAEKKPAPKKKIKSADGHKEPGRENDPASAEKKAGGGSEVKAVGGTQEPGRTGDPASAEKKKN